MQDALLKVVVVAILAVEGAFWIGLALLVLRAGDPAPWFGH